MAVYEGQTAQRRQGGFGNGRNAFSGRRSAPEQQDTRREEKPEPPPCDTEQKKASAQKDPFSGILDGLLGGLHVDGERALLVMLLIILARDGADLKLLLALGYLLM